MFASRFLLTVVVIATTCRAHPTLDQIKNANEIIKGLIAEDIKRIPGFVRLAFHDCVGNGGCDGCIDFNNGDNAGLQTYTTALDSAYQENNNILEAMSRADFYALSAVVALEEATVNTIQKFSAEQFLVGRTDCPTSPQEDDESEEFPSAEWNYEEVTTYFSENFGMSARETTALMGAHTLGRARQENSGYEGAWVPSRESRESPSTVAARTEGEYKLDNEFYTEMINRPWVHTSDDIASKPQWQLPNTERNHPDIGRSRNMFLNSDVCLINQFELNGEKKANCVMCGYNGNRARTRLPPGIDGTCCGESEGETDSLQFRDSNALWLDEFQNVFFKMIDTVVGDLIKPGVGGEITPSPSPETPSSSPETPSPSPETPSSSPETPSPSPETPSPSPETPSPSPETPSPSSETPSPSPETPNPTPRRTSRSPSRSSPSPGPKTPRPKRSTKAPAGKKGKAKQRPPRRKDEKRRQMKGSFVNKLIRQLEDVEAKVEELQDSF